MKRTKIIKQPKVLLDGRNKLYFTDLQSLFLVISLILSVLMYLIYIL